MRDIHIKNVAIGTGSSPDYVFYLQSMQFTKIATVLDAQNDDNSDGVHGNRIPFARYVARKAESTVTFNFGGLDTINKYSSFIVEGNIEVTAALAFEMLIDGQTTLYQNTYTDNDSGTLANAHGVSDTEIVILPATLLDAANREAYFKLEGGTYSTDTTLTGTNFSNAHNEGYRISGWSLGATVLGSNGIASLTFQTSTSTWKVGSEIRIYGVLK